MCLSGAGFHSDANSKELKALCKEACKKVELPAQKDKATNITSLLMFTGHDQLAEWGIV